MNSENQLQITVVFLPDANQQRFVEMVERMFHAKITDRKPTYLCLMIKNGTLARELMDGLVYDVSRGIELEALFVQSNAKPYYQSSFDDTIVKLRPQPVVERMSGGWDISGVPSFMGTAEWHIKTDKRWPGFKRVWLHSDNQWWGELECGSSGS